MDSLEPYPSSSKSHVPDLPVIMSTAGELGEGTAEEMMAQAGSSPDPPNEEPES